MNSELPSFLINVHWARTLSAHIGSCRAYNLTDFAVVFYQQSFSYLNFFVEIVSNQIISLSETSFWTSSGGALGTTNTN